jgi:hypothetical protein
MSDFQASLPLGFGRIHWHHLPRKVQTKVLELWIRLLREHLDRQASSSDAEEER